MRHGIHLWAGVAAAVALAGCGGVSTRDLSGRSILSGEANVRHVYFIPRENPGVICVEPAPDVALGRTTGLSASGDGGRIGADASAEAKFEYATAVVQLAGRTQSVVLARDILFRACMDRANGFLTDPQLFEIYQDTIQLVGDLGAADRNASAAQAARAGVPSAALAWDDTRIALVDRITDALLNRTQAQRQAFIDAAIGCAAADYACLAGLKEVVEAQGRPALRVAVSQLANSKIQSLGRAL